MASILEKILEDLGLSEKETKVYLACLELGESAPADIAKHSGINRATTYVIAEKLTKDGLISQLEKGKKTYFTAENPEQLLRLLRKQEQDIKNKEQEFQKYLPELKTIFDTAGERPKVRFFEGKEGVQAIREDFLKSKDKKIEEIYSDDNVADLFSEDELREVREMRKHRKVKLRGIYTRKEGKLKEVPLHGLNELRFIPHHRFPIDSDILFYDNKVAIFAFKGKLVGVIIENKAITDSLRSIFNLAWEAAEKYDKETK
ncbi:MAG: helix-turn-helix domain-containing protein [Patescibacteria group bacterium]